MSTILSDIMLVVITWRFVDTSSIMNHKVRSSTTKMHHIASIMLHNGMVYDAFLFGYLLKHLRDRDNLFHVSFSPCVPSQHLPIPTS